MRTLRFASILLASEGLLAQSLFSDREAAGGVGSVAEARRARAVRVDLGLIGPSAAKALRQGAAGPRAVHRVQFNFFPDAALTADLERGETFSGGATTTWTGAVAGDPLSSVSVAVTGEIASANVTTGDGRKFFLRPAPDGEHAVYEIDERAFPPEAEPLVPPEDPAGKAEPAREAGARAADDGSVVDVMVVYSTNAKNAVGGATAMNNLIALAFTETNQGYANSGVIQRARLVNATEAAFTDSVGFSTALNQLTNKTDGVLDNIHAIRDANRADMVSLWINNSQFCGLAWLMRPESASFERSAFSVVHHGCATGYYSFAHEMGHNQGSQHDRATASQTNAQGVFPFSFGFQNSATQPYFRTVMAYACASVNCARINYWSAPNISYQGIPAGVAQSSPNSADNAASLNATRVTVANWRQAAAAVALNPTGRDVTAAAGTGSVAVTAAGVSWSAVSSDTSWLTITSGASGSGNGTINYSFTANAGFTSRSARITVNGAVFTLNQAASASCTASAISFGQTINGSLASTDCRSHLRGSSYYADDYTFSATAGQTVVITLNSAALNGYLYLHGPNGALVAQDENTGGSTTSRIPTGSGALSLPATGTYTLEVTSSAGLASGSYSVALAAASTCTYSLVPSSGAAPPQGGNGSFQINTQAGCVWSSDTTSPWISLAEPRSGTGTGTVSFTAASNSNAASRAGSIIAGGQTFNLTQAGQSTCAASPVRLGGSASGSWASGDCSSTLRPGSFSDKFTFFAAAGQAVSITVESATVDTFMGLTGPDGAFALSDDDGGGNLNSRLPTLHGVTTLPQTGIYTIEATTFGAGDTGNYTVFVNAATGGNNDVSSQAIRLTEPAVYSQQVGHATVTTAEPVTSCTAQRNSFTVWFDVVPTFTGVLRASTAGSFYDTVIAGYSGASGSPGGELACNDDFSTSTLLSQIDIPVTAGQRYFIEVASFNDGFNLSTTFPWMTLSLTPVYTTCSYTLNPTTGAAGAGGGSFTPSLTAAQSCPWNAITRDSWITAPAGGVGNASPAINAGAAQLSRTGSATVAGRVFTVVQTVSAGPTITQPASGQTVPVSGVTFQWNAVSGSGGYGLRISQGASTVFQGTLSGSGNTSTLVSLPNGTYTFSVRSCAGGFADANCGAYSSVSFTVALGTPTAAPSIAAPTSGQNFTASTQTFSWTPVSGAASYEVQLDDMAAGGISELNLALFGAPPPTSTIYSMKASSSYRLRVRACTAGCGAWSAAVTFQVTLPAAPASAPNAPSCSVASGTRVTCSWNSIANADLYQILAVQPTGGPGGGALTVAARQVSSTGVAEPDPLIVPSGSAGIVVRACNGNGCGPFSGAANATAPGPNSAVPVLGSPISGTTVGGPDVFFSWSRIPGDTGSNTIYRLYVQDFSRGAAALDILTTSNFYAARFKAGGTRYDALVIANPGAANQAQGPAAGFVVSGNSAQSPTMVQPRHQTPEIGSTIAAGNIQLGWTPVPGATLYEYFVAVSGQPDATVRGVTPGLVVQVPLNGPATFSGIVRACPPGASCAQGSDAGWGPWSNAPGQGGVTTFKVAP